MVKTHAWGCSPRGHAETSGGWGDPIGAAYLQWDKMTDPQRVNLMLHTALDLAMQGFPLKRVLTAFAEVREFRALGGRKDDGVGPLQKLRSGRRDWENIRWLSKNETT